MSQSEQLSSSERLRQHFSSRVLNLARQLIDRWQLVVQDDWDQEIQQELTANTERLLRNAKRYDAKTHLDIAHKILTLLASIPRDKNISSIQFTVLNELIVTLSKTSLRRSDELLDKLPNISQQPIYIALNSEKHSSFINKQMQSFRLYPKQAQSTAELTELISKRLPAALLIDVDFTGSAQGINIAQEIQQQQLSPIPIIFVYHNQRPTPDLQLQMLRANGLGLFETSELQAIISKLEKLLKLDQSDAYKILVVDDSRTQALFIGNVLKDAGYEYEIVNQPLRVFGVLERFNPDLVLMDMYMPDCTGMELARLIRQQKEYINLPIIYLSGEEDRQRQLAAMAEGGDDFLTKPVEPEHLLATLTNRIGRARQLQSLIARDSLTGLLNHTHILSELQRAITLAANDDTPVSFVMLDIDHFKQVNDTYGHPTGDAVIRNLALYLRQHLRRSDPIGRYGGEEFAAVLIGANEEQAKNIMDSIRAGFYELVHDGDTLKASFSCGVAQWQGQSLSELVSLADQALYLSKHNGRNQISTAGQIKDFNSEN